SKDQLDIRIRLVQLNQQFQVTLIDIGNQRALDLKNPLRLSRSVEDEDGQKDGHQRSAHWVLLGSYEVTGKDCLNSTPARYRCKIDQATTPSREYCRCPPDPTLFLR